MGSRPQANPGTACHELPIGMPLSELQAAQRRLAVALVLLPGATNETSAAAALNMDILLLIGNTLADHCTLAPTQHSLCCMAMQSLSRGWWTVLPRDTDANLRRHVCDTPSVRNGSEQRVVNELRACASIRTFEGTGISAVLREGEDVFRWQACIAGPPNTAYAGGLFFLDVDLPHDYPFCPPNIRFTTPVYHCNIRADGYTTAGGYTKRECWSPAMTISKVLISIQCLLSEPNPETSCCASIQREELGQLCRDARDQYDAKAREWTLKHAVIMPALIAVMDV